MSDFRHTSRSAGSFNGVLQILRYNWSLYALTSSAAICCFVAGIMLRNRAAEVVDWFGIILIGWMTVSLSVSHYIYDRSNLYDFRWMSRKLAAEPRTWLNIHCGLDKSSNLLSALFPDSASRIFDIFDPAEMTEPSIARARRPGVLPALCANFRNLPLPSDRSDAVFLIFAAHEIRSASSRRQFFAEIARVLSGNGTVIMIEHLRNLPNFLAFGPGFLHFHSRREWLRVASSAHLALVDEFPITAFVRVFLWSHNHDAGTP